MADRLPSWLRIEVTDVDGEIDMNVLLPVSLTVGPVTVEIGEVKGRDSFAVEQLLRATADEMKHSREARNG